MTRRLIFPIIFILLSATGMSAMDPSVLESQELTVVYDGGLEQSARFAQRMYADSKQELQTLFQWPVSFRPTLVLINDHHQFRQMARHPLVVAYALPSENVMVIDHTRMTTEPFNLQATIKHELCHLVLHHHIKGERLPRWLDEGVCQWASDGLADIILDTRRELLPAAILSGRYLDLANLKHRFPHEKNGLILAYEQSKSIVDYMSRTFGQQGVLDLLELLRQGNELELAVERRFAMTFDQLEARWREHLKKNINWFTYLSIHLYEILFVSAALLTILAFIRRVLRKKAYADQAENSDEL
ncbi:MAG: peptidase MA family metallohydrolase [Desulfobacterales bacterium]